MHILQWQQFTDATVKKMADGAVRVTHVNSRLDFHVPHTPQYLEVVYIQAQRTVNVFILDPSHYSNSFHTLDTDITPLHIHHP